MLSVSTTATVTAVPIELRVRLAESEPWPLEDALPLDFLVDERRAEVTDLARLGRLVMAYIVMPS